MSFGKQSTWAETSVLTITETLADEVTEWAATQRPVHDHEMMLFMFCQRVWHNGQNFYQPKHLYFPRGADYDSSDDRHVALSGKSWGWILSQLARTTHHLVWVHTHPVFNHHQLAFSARDVDTYRDAALQLQQLPGQKMLMVGVTDHIVSLRRAKFQLWEGSRQNDMKVLVSRKPHLVNGKDYTSVGSIVTGEHRCMSSRPLQPIIRESLGNLAHQWKGYLLATDNKSLKVWEDTPAEQVQIKITHWPPNCGCAMRSLIKQPVSLVQLGHTGAHHPWRSG